MILKVEQSPHVNDIEVNVKYKIKNRDVDRVVTMLETLNARIQCMTEGGTIYVNVSDIYYVESVDRKTFIYLKEGMHEVDRRLYQVAEELKNAGFVQVNKSCILNLNRLEQVTPLLNRRLEARLENGDRILVTRKYIHNIKEALESGR